MTKMAAMYICGKNLNNQLLWNQIADELESWYAALDTQVLPSLFKWWPWDDPDLFYGKVKFGLLCFCMGKGVKQYIFFRNYCSLWYKSWWMQSTVWVHEALWVPTVKVIHWPLFKLLRFNILNFFFSITTWPIEAIFYVKSPWHEGTKACSNYLCYMTKRTTKPIYGKFL